MGTIAAESGGNPNALHPLVKSGQYAGQRAIGLFGIMPGNVPQWSKEHLGRAMTPEELAQDTEAQRAIFRGEMQKNIAKHGSPQDAASIWFTGRPFAQAAAAGANDGLTNVQNYVAKVTGSAPSAATPTPAQQAGATMLPRPIGSLGGLGGLPEPTGMQTFGNFLQAAGMALLSSPNNNPFQNLPQMVQEMAKSRAAQSMQQYNMQKDERDFGLRKEDLEARRAEQAIDNARQERAQALAERNAEVSGLGETAKLTMARFGITPKDPTWMEKYKIVADEMRQANPAKTSLTPTWGTDDQGNTVGVVPDDQGGVKELKLPPGFKREAGVDKIDAGTHWIIRDKATGQSSTVAKNAAELESQKKQGQSLGERIAGAPARLDTITKSINEVDAILDDPNKWWGTGVMSLGNSLPGSPGLAFQERVKQARAGAFAEGVQVLKGFGSLTEKEGDKAESAQQRMNTALSEKDFNRAASDYREALVAAQMKIKRFMAENPGVRPGGAAPAAAPSSGGGRMRFDANGNPM
jgi:hypothetical protein